MNDQAIRNRRLAIQTAIRWYGNQRASNVAAAYEREAKGIAGHDDIAARKRGDQHATNALREAMALVSDLIFELQEDTNEEAPTSRTIRGAK